MAINLQKLIDEIQTRLNATTGSTPVSDLSRLSKISSTVNDMTSSVTSYPGLSNFPVADSSNHGDIVYSLDSGAYRISEQLAWREITLNADSAIASSPSPTQAQGSTSGYTSGGSNTGFLNTIDKFPFTSDGNATDVGDLTAVKNAVTGQSSSTNGYASGGWRGPSPGNTNVIEKFPFSSDANATDVGDLTLARSGASGQSSTDNGYTSGGFAPGSTNVIDKFPFASDGNATDVGDAQFGGGYTAGQSSADNGYISGRYPATNVIDKFPFSSDTNATDVGDLTVARFSASGQSSADNGYSSGGSTGPVDHFNTIDKFPFASDANATDVGDLTGVRRNTAGQSSTASGYVSGGNTSPAPNGGATYNIIEKFPFASDGNAADVGDLTVARNAVTGQQV